MLQTQLKENLFITKNSGYTTQEIVRVDSWTENYINAVSSITEAHLRIEMDDLVDWHPLHWSECAIMWNRYKNQGTRESILEDFKDFFSLDHDSHLTQFLASYYFGFDSF